MRATIRNKVIFSAYRYNCSAEENEGNHKVLCSRLKSRGIDFIEAIGHYKGLKERSIILQSGNLESFELHQKLALHYALFFEQESVLFVHHDYHAELWYIDLEKMSWGNCVAIGDWKEVTNIADKDSYTEVNASFYICE